VFSSPPESGSRIYINSNMRRFHYAIIICLILFSVFSVYFLIPDENSFAKDADEGYYLRFASIVAERGIVAFPPLIKSFNDNVSEQIYPLPSRVGHIMLTALWFKIFGAGYVSLAKFSFFCYLSFILICFYFSRKFFGKDISYIFCLFLSSSPLLMAMARRALLDSSVNLFCGLAIWIFLDFLITRKNYKFFIFLLIFAFSITVKESSLLLTIFFVTSYLVHKYYFKNAIPQGYLLGIIFVPLIIVCISYIVLLGGITNVSAFIKIFSSRYLGVDKLAPYTILFCSGPWYRYIIDYLLLAGPTTLLCIGYLGFILATRRWDSKIAYFLSNLLVIFTIFSNFNFPKVVRYVMTLNTPISLFSVLMLYELFRQNDTKRQAQFVFISAIAVFFINYGNFIHLFGLHDIYDPVSYWLLLAHNMIP
jgi:4-amino-4-deoxy-L-arabinose transferase-like glycosyltransferase